jgi:hypothetical protein
LPGSSNAIAGPIGLSFHRYTLLYTRKADLCLLTL